MDKKEIVVKPSEVFRNLIDFRVRQGKYEFEVVNDLIPDLDNLMELVRLETEIESLRFTREKTLSEFQGDYSDLCKELNLI